MVSSPRSVREVWGQLLGDRTGQPDLGLTPTSHDPTLLPPLQPRLVPQRGKGIQKTRTGRGVGRRTGPADMVRSSFPRASVSPGC